MVKTPMQAKTPDDTLPEIASHDAVSNDGKELEPWNPNEPVDVEWEAAWERECDRRWAEYEAGLVELIPEEQVFAEVHADSNYHPLLLAEDRRTPLSRQWLDDWGEELSWRDDEHHTGRDEAVNAHTILAELGGHLRPGAEITMFRSAGRDLQRAMQRYNEQSPGLGQEFMQAIASELALLAENPRSGRIVDPDQPTCPPGALAYTIVYQTESGSVLVKAIANRNRGPDPEVVAEREAQLARAYAGWGDDTPEDPRWAAAWCREIRRREREMMARGERLIPHEEVMRDLRARRAHRRSQK